MGGAVRKRAVTYGQMDGRTGAYCYLLPDVEVAEEAAHLPFGQGATRERVVVARQQVHP